MLSRITFCLTVLIAVAAVAPIPPVMAQEVNGVYTDASTKDLGDLTGVAAFKGIKVRGWLEGYYAWNANRPDKVTVNANQGSSVLRASDLTIEGRTFDVKAESLRLNLAEIEIEKVPERGRFGFKVDLAGGDTQDILYDTIRAIAPGSVEGWDRIVQHASVSYLAPLGSGLRIDVGKFVTHIGMESIESIKNRNFSHDWLYSYAIPFQDTGLRLNYNFNPKVYGEIYVLKGWNVTYDNNDRRSYGLSVGWNPSEKLSFTANYLGGPERNGDDYDRRDLLDLQLTYALSSTLSTAVNVDFGRDALALPEGRDANWGGIAVYLRKNVGDRFSPTLRVEYFSDPQGFTTGVAQHVVDLTLTGDTRVGGRTSFVKLLLRPEVRYDRSDAPFFTDHDRFRDRKDQFTAALAAVLWF
ncbi:MAG TPA: outer membrane beta-barrel protein [Thermoanaerobaculia bacterium]|nr:outer membrane beta-barrel protein [Thermoanaerobaculia bacterium]